MSKKKRPVSIKRAAKKQRTLEQMREYRKIYGECLIFVASFGICQCWKRGPTGNALCYRCRPLHHAPAVQNTALEMANIRLKHELPYPVPYEDEKAKGS